MREHPYLWPLLAKLCFLLIPRNTTCCSQAFKLLKKTPNQTKTTECTENTLLWLKTQVHKDFAINQLGYRREKRAWAVHCMCRAGSGSLTVNPALLRSVAGAGACWYWATWGGLNGGNVWVSSSAPILQVLSSPACSPSAWVGALSFIPKLGFLWEAGKCGELLGHVVGGTTRCPLSLLEGRAQPCSPTSAPSPAKLHQALQGAFPPGRCSAEAPAANSQVWGPSPPLALLFCKCLSTALGSPQMPGQKAGACSSYSPSAPQKWYSAAWRKEAVYSCFCWKQMFYLSPWWLYLDLMFYRCHFYLSSPPFPLTLFV